MLIGTVGAVLANKGHQIHSVSPSATVFHAIEVMAKNSVAAVLVISEGSLAGIVSARDYARKVILKGKSSKDVRVEEIMTTSLITVPPGTTVLDAMALMTRHHIRHLPVLENGKLDGVVSMGDLVSEVISGQAFIIDQLQKYVGHIPV